MCDQGRRDGYSASDPYPSRPSQGRNAIFSLCDEESPLHKHSEEFRLVPPIASTIEHIGETRLGARHHSRIRPAIGAQTPWHDIRWLRLSLGTSEAFPVRICKRSLGVFLLIKTMQ